MSYAIYCESYQGYVHLVAGASETEVFQNLVDDLESVSLTFKDLIQGTVYACKGREEYPDLENLVKAHIENEVYKENQ
jgi:hypothetical protein